MNNVVVPIEDNLEDFVKTREFDRQCSNKASELAAALFSDEGSGHSDNDTSRSQDDPVSSATTPASAPDEVSRFEATHYYSGVGPKGQGPLLVYRDSPDVFEEPSGPEAYKRLMRIVPVPDDHEFGRDGQWDEIRDHVGVFSFIKCNNSVP